MQAFSPQHLTNAAVYLGMRLAYIGCYTNQPIVDESEGKAGRNWPLLAHHKYRKLFTNQSWGATMTITQIVRDFFLCRWLGCILYLIFLFSVIVIMLNLLIAQMTDTFVNFQLDAQRELAINQAWTICLLERTGLIGLVSIAVFPYMKIAAVFHRTR